MPVPAPVNAATSLASNTALKQVAAEVLPIPISPNIKKSQP